ncbi:MAG TPA: efflux RND transporter periplasmic adaptor subunit [Gemmataceae bacterium]|nr:efflux RND transporter periplasmic adaptor subunit [Gemmataceae bacterium]
MSAVQLTTAATPPTHHRGGARLLAGGALFALLVAGGLAAGTIPRLNQDRAVREQAAETAAQPPRVATATATRVAPDAERVLPGNCLPLTEIAIYPRTTGYLKRWTVDIGDRVKAGQLLAEIATPEIDAQLEQARATLVQGQANLVRAQAQEVYAKAEEKRVKDIYKAAAGSKNAYDSAVAASQVATANVGASEATLKVDQANILRLETLQSFQKITAPFDGVITARNIDPGALVQADTPTTTRELFHLMRTDAVRVWVYVPQTFATTVKAGQAVTVYRREDPARTFAGTVARTADALDPNTRTLLTEVHVPNPDNALRPGMYLQVRFTFDRSILPVVIPSAAVVIRDRAPTVGVVDAGHAVRYRRVQLGRDYGATVEVTAGLDPGEVVAVHPGDDLPDGTVVEPVPQPAK